MCRHNSYFRVKKKKFKAVNAMRRTRTTEARGGLCKLCPARPKQFLDIGKCRHPYPWFSSTCSTMSLHSSAPALTLTCPVCIHAKFVFTSLGIYTHGSHEHGSSAPAQTVPWLAYICTCRHPYPWFFSICSTMPLSSYASAQTVTYPFCIRASLGIYTLCSH